MEVELGSIKVIKLLNGEIFNLFEVFIYLIGEDTLFLALSINVAHFFKIFKEDKKVVHNCFGRP